MVIFFSVVLSDLKSHFMFFFFFQAEDGIRDLTVTGVQTCALPIFVSHLVLVGSAPAGAPRRGRCARWRGPHVGAARPGNLGHAAGADGAGDHRQSYDAHAIADADVACDRPGVRLARSMP